MGAPALGGVAAVVSAIEQSADMDALGENVRVVARRLGYDRFVLYTAPPSGNGPEDGIVDHLLWVEGDWFGDSKLNLPPASLRAQAGCEGE